MERPVALRPGLLRALTLVVLATATAADGRAQRLSDLEGIVLRESYTYGVAVTLVYAPHVLFRDGTITRDLAGAPPTTDAEVNAWRARAPDAWGRWRREGDRLVVSWPGREPETWARWFVARPADSSLAPSGVFRSTRAVGTTGLGGDQAVLAVAEYVFRPDGTFERNRGAGARAGRTVSRSSAPTERGRFRLDGWTVALTPDGGPTRRLWYYRFPDDERVIGIGATTYRRPQR